MADASEALEDINWTIDLESALIDGCDFGTLRNICKGRPIPDHLRPEIWQICLNVADKGDQLAAFDELYDMPEQTTLREDCQALVDKLGNDDEEKLSVASDLESILTYYCKCRGETYSRHNGWLEILQPMLALKYSKADLYNCVYAFLTKYIPRGCHKSGTPFHLFRLLLLYHDPQLCTFMDTRKITPDMYLSSWFQSLFASVCPLDVIMAMWDVYLQQTDQFLLFFLSLVMLINAKEQILAMNDSSRQDIIDCLEAFPTALQAEDVQDFCSLAQYYGSHTSQSFRRVYHEGLFGTTVASQIQQTPNDDVSVAQALCLPVSVSELLQANTLSSGEGVRYFVVDCRPAEQYNAGHLPIAFHLDANLMLQNPTEFANSVKALSMAQKQAISSGSVAGGEHLCFMGSGRDEEDQYVNMVIANFLQRNCLFVSLASGGYAALHEVLGTDLRGGLTDHNARHCIVCHPDTTSSNGVDSHDEYQAMDNGDGHSLIDKFGKLSSVVKSKSVSMKEMMINYIKNEPSVGAVERHVSSTDRVGKRYRNMESVFTIGDDDGDDDEVNDMSVLADEHRDVVNIETWKKKQDVTYSCQCQEVRSSGYTYPSHLLITETHLFVLREIPERPHMAWVQVRRALGNIVKITSKKKHPELITFKYGANNGDKGIIVTDLDRFIIPKAVDR
ncbi:TBC1 domain family member 23 [Lamellibrachia satsuma]|nr:TBC1 domain family member 23 [Lamellibrachia satsuma]